MLRVADGLHHGRIRFIAARQGPHRIAAQQPEPADAVAQYLQRGELRAGYRRHIHGQGVDLFGVHHHGFVPQLRYPRLANPVDPRHEIEQGTKQRRKQRHPHPADGRPDVLLGHRGMHRRARSRHDADGKHQMGPVIDQNCVYAIHSDDVKVGLQG
ncbi:hypothetical protein D3C73_1312860 [compost metagenome]